MQLADDADPAVLPRTEVGSTPRDTMQSGREFGFYLRAGKSAEK
jgi:hypothetical protein